MENAQGSLLIPGSWLPGFLRVLPIILLAAAPGCKPPSSPHVVSAEWNDEAPASSISIRFDRALPADFRLDQVRMITAPPIEWTRTLERTRDPRVLKVNISSGASAFHPAGVYGRDFAATGLGFDLGNGAVEWVDLQPAPSLPVLERAIWEDRAPPGGNLIVDQGDRIRLIFDRPVKLNVASPDSARVRSRQDVILSKTNDRLDDGVLHSTFEEGESDNEINIVLGSRPVLTIGGSLPAAPEAIERFRVATPSGLALNGTRVLPLAKITHRRGGPGALSLREIDIEYPAAFPFPRPRAAESFPPPGHRIFHTVTPVWESAALVAGGSAAQGRQALDQVLLYDPSFSKGGKRAPFTLPGKLPHPVYFHTATLLAGPDEAFGTPDDVVLIGGGTDGIRSLADLTLLCPKENGEVEILPLEPGLRAPRAEHAAAAVGPNRVLFDGGKSSGLGGPSGLVGCAELVGLTFEGGKARLAEHQVFRTLARRLHTLTLLPPSIQGNVYALAYGGHGRGAPTRQGVSVRPDVPMNLSQFGQPIDGSIPGDVYFTDDGAVLVSPILIDLARPAASLVSLPLRFSFSLLRMGHAAVPLDPVAGASGPAVSNNVILIGGTPRHPIHGFDSGPSLWEMPLEALPFLPQSHDGANAILFKFDELEPSKSRFEVVLHPSPDPAQALAKVFFSAVTVPGLGVVLTGGQQPGVESRDIPCLGSAEVFLGGEERLAELAARLAQGRARHQAYLVDRPDKRSIFLLGGITSPEERASFSDVEEIPLPR
jgi:hypothetical protein